MPATTQEDSSFKRKLSKREKKGLKKAEKAAKAAGKIGDKDGAGGSGPKTDESMAEKLYSGMYVCYYAFFKGVKVNNRTFVNQPLTSAIFKLQFLFKYHWICL